MLCGRGAVGYKQKPDQSGVLAFFETDSDRCEKVKKVFEAKDVDQTKLLKDLITV